MKIRISAVVMMVIIFCLTLGILSWAGDLEELKLKKQLLETQLSNLQLQVQLIQQSFSDKQKELAVVNEQIRLKEPKKEEPKKQEKK